MKFLCDRCKTRYSIADDRVRGKILKIRCKNCANVITVREGMGDVPAELPAQRAAAASHGAAARPLAAAFATAMSSPRIAVATAPAALHEEWYVSIDGAQSGPFSLPQAQAWVAGRRASDELYCWSEGFDDWLPVEKVRHFRGVRGRSRPRTEPPPLPTADSGRHLRPQHGDPPSLFAATLAALDNDATAISAPPVKRDLAARPAATADAGALHRMAAAGNGRPVPTGPVRSPSRPIDAMFGKGSPTPANGANGRLPPARPMFDGTLDDDELPEPGAPDALSAGAARTALADEPSSDDLEIGEVSRVVRIADLSKVAPRRTPAASAIARGTGGVPKLDQVALAAGGDGLAAMSLLGAAPGEPMAAPPQPRTHTVLLAGGVAAVALIAALVVVLAAQGNVSDDGLGPTLDQGEDLISRVSMEVTVVALPRPRPSDPAAPNSNPSTSPGTRPSVGGGRPRPSITTEPTIAEPDRSGLRALSVDEVDSMSRRMSTGPRRCYEQATKKDPFLEVKTIKAVITIDKSGLVSNVELLNRASAHLDTCLAAAIKRWKFRENSEGLATQISFVFASS